MAFFRCFVEYVMLASIVSVCAVVSGSRIFLCSFSVLFKIFRVSVKVFRVLW